MRKIFTILTLLKVSLVLCQEPKTQQSPPNWIFELINETGLELVYGERFPYINPLSEGNFGSPIIQGFYKTNNKIPVSVSKNIYRDEIIPYYLFLCREEKKDNIVNNEKKAGFIKRYNYYNSFNYYLVFIVKENHSYKIKNIYKWYLLGMESYHWKMRDEWKGFSKLIGQKDSEEYTYKYRLENSVEIKDINNYSPIIAYSDLGYNVLVLYNNEWYVHYVDSHNE